MMPADAPDRVGVVSPVRAKQILRALALLLEVHVTAFRDSGVRLPDGRGPRGCLSTRRRDGRSPFRGPDALPGCEAIVAQVAGVRMRTPASGLRHPARHDCSTPRGAGDRTPDARGSATTRPRYRERR